MVRRLLAAVSVAALLGPAGVSGAVGPAPAVVAQADDGPDVTAKGAVLYDAADDRMLWGEGAETALPPASTTKIMTVLLALEAGAVDDTVTVSAYAAEVGRTAGAATLGLQAGQQIAMRSLLEGLVLRSGNDAAVAVAEHVAGSEDAFVDKMNARAAELGMTDTNFINSTGLTNDLDHHASALDLARLADRALTHPDFARWAATATTTVPGLGTLTNRNELLGRYPGATGVKTGYTNLAGLCLVASAERDDRPLIAVVLGSEASFTDATAILEHGYTDFRRAAIAAQGERVTRYRWAGARVPLRAAEELGRTLGADQRARWRLALEPAAALPVAPGAALGRAELLVDGRVVDSTELVAGRAVPRPTAEAGAAGAGVALQEALRAFARLHAVGRRI